MTLVNQIPLTLKKECAERYNAGISSRRIYNDVFRPCHEGMSYESFRHKLYAWSKQKRYADPETLEKGTYEGFTAHGATVQVDKKGGIVQAWIKQSADELSFEKLLDAIKSTKYEQYTVKSRPSGENMLEIPFFDLHFPYDEYAETFKETAEIISSREWERIIFIIGQDLFHNDDFHGNTTSGRQIDRVDMASAWQMARRFYCGLIEKALSKAATVEVMFSSGNHSESFEWCFIQMLKEIFPQVWFDDERAPRKAIYWKGVFIGVSHACHLKKARADDIRGMFTIEYPEEFAQSKTREIHLGHLHHETANDVYGVVIRRLASATPENEWGKDCGFVGAKKRFQLFAYAPGKLKAVYYV